jgi:hypothetical protein
MTPPHSSRSPRDVDLHRTRRAFLFAREQVAAHTRGDLAGRNSRRGMTHYASGVVPLTDAPDSTTP